MTCMRCKNTTINTTTYFGKVNDFYVIIENVPCLKCPECGEAYFSLQVMDKIDGIIKNVTGVLEKVKSIDYNNAA